jgi:hypothetical protein
MKRIGLAVVLFLPWPASAQSPDGGTFLLLQDKFGELCTMCEATLTCVPNDSAAAPTTLRFQKKTFLGQMRTVLDFVPGLGPGAWEERPVIVALAGQERTEAARLSTAEAQIQIAEMRIDRRTGAWSDVHGKTMGTCSEVATTGAGG